MDGEGGIDHQKFNRQPADHATLRRQAAARERTATTNALAFRRFRLPPVSCLEHQLQPHLLRLLPGGEADARPGCEHESQQPP